MIGDDDLQSNSEKFTDISRALRALFLSAMME
jgi:hypothetical protein